MQQTVAALGPVGFVLEGGEIAPGHCLDFTEITCPQCKKKMIAGMENIVVLVQAGDEGSRVFLHEKCLATIAGLIAKGSDEIPVVRS